MTNERLNERAEARRIARAERQMARTLPTHWATLARRTLSKPLATRTTKTGRRPAGMWILGT